MFSIALPNAVLPLRSERSVLRCCCLFSSFPDAGREQTDRIAQKVLYYKGLPKIMSTWAMGVKLPGPRADRRTCGLHTSRGVAKASNGISHHDCALIIAMHKKSATRRWRVNFSATGGGGQKI
jgi:hypothetical protein